MGSKLTDERKATAEWLAVPVAMREIKNRRDFAASIGVHHNSVYLWCHDEEVVAEAARLSKKYMREYLPEIFGTIAKKAIAGNISFVNLALALTGEANSVADSNSTKQINVDSDKTAKDLLDEIRKKRIPEEFSEQESSTQELIERYDK